MTIELERSEWKNFFDGLSHELADWETTVHVLDGKNGAQVLTERLPFHGMTYEGDATNGSIGISVGFGRDNHQTHNIKNPRKVAFAERGHGPAGTLDIEDNDGVTTLITFIEPHRELLKEPHTEIATR